MDPKTYRRNLLIPFIKIILDGLATEGAFLFSFYLRFHSPVTKIFPVTKGYPSFQHYLFTSFVLVIIYLTLFSIFHSYRSRYFSNFNQDIPVVIKTCLVGILFAMSGAFLYRGFSYSRLTFLLVFINTTFFVLITRFIFHRIKSYFMRLGYGIQQLVAVGSPPQLSRFLSRFNRDANQNLKIFGYCSGEELPDCSFPYLGNLDDLSEITESTSVDGLLLTFDVIEHRKVIEIMQLAEGKNIELFYIPDLLDLITTRAATIEISGLPVLQLKAVAFSGWQGFLKRTFDLLISAGSTILLSPLFLLIAALIKLTSKGPVFYRQPRVGLDGREFTMLKFRSMKANAEKETGPVWTRKEDPRATPIGRFLRRTSLDELPQLINVLRGDMSLVGPRPERKVFVEQFKQQIPKYAERQRVRSGMTGWAQVNGLRGQSSIVDRTKFDVYYIENWSLWFDIKIILMTFAAILHGENAY